jgi:hypothetical protein
MLIQLTAGTSSSAIAGSSIWRKCCGDLHSTGEQQFLSMHGMAPVQPVTQPAHSQQGQESLVRITGTGS